MLIGYARVSTQDQNLDLQLDALKRAGCEKIFCDQISGVKTSRPQLDLALQALNSGDTLLVWKLDRLGRSLGHLIATIKSLEQKQVGFKTVQDGIDTTTPAGRLVFHIFGALAEFERELIRERTLAGLASARQRGRVGGAKRRFDYSAAQKMHIQGLTQSAIAKSLGVHQATISRALG